MNRCADCGVNVDTGLKKCPLCGKTLTEEPGENGLYPNVSEQRYIDKHTLLDDTLVFFAFVFIGGSIVLNMIFWEGTPWFLAVCASILDVWLLIRVTIVSNLSAGAKAFTQLAGIMGMMLVFDYLSGWRGWSYEYALPFLLIAAIVFIDIYSWIHKSYWRDNIVYALLFIGLGFIPLILYFTGVSSALVPMILSSIAGIVTILGILRFAIRSVSVEMKKRFHI